MMLKVTAPVRQKTALILTYDMHRPLKLLIDDYNKQYENTCLQQMTFIKCVLILI